MLDALFNIMEDGKATVSSGAVIFNVESIAPITLLANPSDIDNPEKGFGAMLEKLTENPAMGRRIGIMLYGNDYKVIEGRSTPEFFDQWKASTQFYLAVEEHAKPQLKQIYNDPRLWSWLSQPIPKYEETVKKLSTPITKTLVKSFIQEHGKAGQSRVRAWALNIAIIDHLNIIALNEYQLTEILEAADDVLPDLVAINLESIGNLVQNVGKDLGIYAEAYYNQLPEYAQVIVQTVEYARRNGILGNNFYLNSIEYTPESETYRIYPRQLIGFLEGRRSQAKGHASKSFTDSLMK